MLLSDRVCRMDEESTKQKVRQNANPVLAQYFKTQDFSVDEYSPRDKGRIEQVTNHIADTLELPLSFKLSANEHATSKLSTPERLWLRAYVTHTLARLKHKGKIQRIMHGVYRPLIRTYSS